MRTLLELFNSSRRVVALLTVCERCVGALEEIEASIDLTS